MSEEREDEQLDVAPEVETGDVVEESGDAGAGADERLIRIVESVLFAAGEPLPLARIAEVIPGPTRGELRAALTALATWAEDERRGLRLVEVAGGYQLRTAPEHAEWVRRLFQQKPWRLTRATLETLAIVAYKQPITRAEIELIRGVDADSVLASLLTRKLIKIVGRKDVIGRPLLYGTTRHFLEVFGLKDLTGLPVLTEVVASLTEGVSAGAAATSEEDSGSDDHEPENERDATAEGLGGGGPVLAPDRGEHDPAGASDPERSNGHGARDPGAPD